MGGSQALDWVRIINYLPESGQIVEIVRALRHTQGVADPELLAHVAGSTGLSAADAERVIDDVLHWYAESVEGYVRRRHAELKLGGVRNEAAFVAIKGELSRRLVRPPPLGERQLRRLVYG